MVYHKTDLNSHPFKKITQQVIFESDLIGVSLIDQPLEELKNHHPVDPQMELHQYLDKFYLWIPINHSGKRQEVLDGFFSLIANEYDTLVDTNRNLENINILLDKLSRIIPPSGLVIDYGCGTGLSVVSANHYSFRVVGVDRCPNMRRIAASKGLSTWSMSDLARHPPTSVDGAFASYVFHLLPSVGGIKLLWSRIKKGGILIANYHKNQGMQLIDQYLVNLQGRIVLKEENRIHGIYTAYEKRI